MKHIKEKMVRRTKMYLLEGRKDKGLCLRSHLFLGMSLAVVLLFACAGVASATVTYDGTKILISDGTENLITINQVLNTSSLLEQLSANEWLLKVPIQVQSTGILYLNNTDCDWLKLLSRNDGNEAYIENRGVLDMYNTKVTSWDSSTNSVAPKTDSTRAYIYSQGIQLRAVSCNLSWLGCPLSGAHKEYGLCTYDSNGALIENVTASNNWQGLEVSTSNSQIIDFETFHNVYYGIGVGFRDFPISGLKFENVTIYENGQANFITQFTWSDTFVLTDSEIINMTSHTGVGNLITLRRSKNVTICDSIAHDSGYLGYWHSCIDIHSYNHNITVDNCEAWTCETPFLTHNWNTNVTFRNCVAHDSTRGFEIQGGCTNNLIENCTAYDINGNGFMIHSSSENYITNCTAYNSTRGAWFYSFNWTSWPGGIFGDYNETWSCYGNVFQNCDFSDTTTNYYFQALPQSHERYVDYRGVNYIINQIEPSVEIIKSADAHPTLQYKYDNGRVFQIDGEWVPCYSNRSYKEWTTADVTTITAYDLYAVPSIEQVNTVVNKFDTSLPQGEVLVNFTADTTDGNNVVFTVWDLKPDHFYLIKRDGVDFVTKHANSSYVQFSNSEWPIGPITFTMVETSTSSETGTIEGKVTDNETGSGINGATVTAEGTGKSGGTDINGDYTLTDVPAGVYTVTVSAYDYEDASELGVVVKNGETVTLEIQLSTSTHPELPEWWSYYIGAGEGTWGRTTREAHTGNHSAFLKGTAYEYETDHINLGLIAGKSNGYSGPDAYTVVPNTTYTLSFWLKGDFTNIGVYAMTWNTEDGSSGRNWGTTSIGGITPTETWTRYEGTFTTPADAKKFVVMFKAEGDSTQENLGTIYVDDVDVNIGAGNLIMNPGAEGTDFCALSGTVTTNTTQGETGLANATVTLTTVEGTEINTIQTDSTGRYEFTDVSPGNYDITATKRSYWPDSDPVTVTTEYPETADIVLCQKGDFNTNSEPADAGDLAMMADATAAGTSDETYDLDGDGNPADEADLTLLKDVSVGVAELE